MGHEEEPFQLTEEKVPDTISPQPWAGLQPHNLPHQTLTQLILNSSQVSTGIQAPEDLYREMGSHKDERQRSWDQL